MASEPIFLSLKADNRCDKTGIQASVAGRDNRMTRTKGVTKKFLACVAGIQRGKGREFERKERAQSAIGEVGRGTPAITLFFLSLFTSRFWT